MELAQIMNDIAAGHPTSPPTPPPTTPSFIGCAVDSWDRDLSLLQADSYQTTVERCVYECGIRYANLLSSPLLLSFLFFSRLLFVCRDFEYAGLQYSTQCFCGHTYGSQGMVPDSECTRPCAGDNSEICGDGWRNSIYKTGDVSFDPPSLPTALRCLFFLSPFLDILFTGWLSGMLRGLGRERSVALCCSDLDHDHHGVSPDLL